MVLADVKLTAPAQEKTEPGRGTHTVKKARTALLQLEWCRARFITSMQTDHDHASNSWFVLYNYYLCQKYDYHVIVETCVTVQSIKYLYKYVYKGRDGNDENNTAEEHADKVKQSPDARYLSDL
ncbi:Helitron helicase [Phytophthora megakarya]|uniref:Helitron helicase n=1 Tax=Phytophthora megakarya TaxID=4795 RepID=A0A225VCQ2_9STRA|nr:Helitron helicase [Phytophthora megakarya]